MLSHLEMFFNYNDQLDEHQSRATTSFCFSVTDKQKEASNQFIHITV